MRRLRGIALGARSYARTALAVVPLLVTACDVERTPSRYFDHAQPVQSERGAAVAELRDRLLAFGEALQRGSAAEALVALSPADDVYVLGPDSLTVAAGAEQIMLVVERVASAPVAVEMRDVEVRVGPRGNVAWFRGRLIAPGRGPEGTAFRITGVFVRDAGTWRLVQAHLSLPVNPQATDPPPSPQVPVADSAVAE